MYYLFNDLRGFAFATHDGAEGRILDVYFDDQDWAVRYVVGDIGSILSGRKIVVNSEALQKPDLDRRRWPVDLGKDELEGAPGTDHVQTVSDQEERRLSEMRVRWPRFMLAPAGAGYTPLLAEQQIRDLMADREAHEEPAEVTTHLRSMAEVCGYSVRATNGKIGSVTDFLIDPESLHVRHILVDTGNWLPGKQVVLSVDQITDVNWDAGEVSVSATTEQVETSPEPEEVPGLTRREEDLLLTHYGGMV